MSCRVNGPAIHWAPVPFTQIYVEPMGLAHILNILSSTRAWYIESMKCSSKRFRAYPIFCQVNVLGPSARCAVRVHGPEQVQYKETSVLNGLVNTSDKLCIFGFWKNGVLIS